MTDWEMGRFEISRFGIWGVVELGACRIGGLEYDGIWGFKSARTLGYPKDPQIVPYPLET